MVVFKLTVERGYGEVETYLCSAGKANKIFSSIRGAILESYLRFTDKYGYDAMKTLEVSKDKIHFEMDSTSDLIFQFVERIDPDDPEVCLYSYYTITRTFVDDIDYALFD